MTVAVLIITDGRDEYLDRTVAAAQEHLTGGPIVEWWMYDDTGDHAHRVDLAARYPDMSHIHAGTRQGFAGAIRHSWDRLARLSQASHVFHLEEDFVITRRTDLTAMAAVLDEHPELVQLALRRQAWNAAERTAGGLVEQHPTAYTDRCDDHGNTWLEHRLFYTSNPSLIRLSLCTAGWLVVDRSEAHYSAELLQHGLPGQPGDELRFAFWGSRYSGVWAEHIGHTRVGTGY